MIGDMRLGIADHLGWAVAVTGSADHEVVDRRRIELVEPGMTAAPIQYEAWRLDVAPPSDRARGDDCGRLSLLTHGRWTSRLTSGRGRV